MRQAVILASIISLFLPATAFPATIIIPDDQPTIQAGIDAAVNGDTVLVRDGTWTGSGNRDLDLGGKAITVASMGDPQNCIIDCEGTYEENHRGFIFQSGEVTDSVVEGFTIMNGLTLDSAYEETGGGILCRNGSSPLIIGNIITDCESWHGAGISCLSSSPSIVNNVIFYNFTNGLGAGIHCDNSAPLIAGNTLELNLAGGGGGISCWYSSTPHIINNLILNNHQIYATSTPYGSSIDCGMNSAPLVENCTLTGNEGNSGGCCVHTDDTCTATIRNSILWGNDCDISYDYYSGTPPTVVYSDVEDGWPGLGTISADPLFVTGPVGDHYLSQMAAGQGADSPCLDTGSQPAATVCYTVGTDPVCLDSKSTRTDELSDAGTVDMGYHSPDLNLVSASLDCLPSSGTMPFSTAMSVSMTNNHPSSVRRLSGRIDVTLAGGGCYTNWRAGYTNLGAGAVFTASWGQTIPALGSLIGDNIFELLVADVTPPPWNQPPYPPSGDTGLDHCTVTAAAP